MGSVSLSLAAITGALSVLNPCGFPLLPAFLSFYVGTDDSRLPSAPSRVAQGLQIGLFVTAGFLGVFTLIGLPITYVEQSILFANCGPMSRGLAAL